MDLFNMSKQELEEIISKEHEKGSLFLWNARGSKMPNFTESITEGMFHVKASLFCHEYKNKSIIMEHTGHMRFSNKLTNIDQCEWIYKGFLKDRKLRIRIV